MSSAFKKVFIIALSIAVPVAALVLLHSAWAAFTWGNFHFLDYGGYTNMIWNTAHGAPFRVLLDRSYLEFHLSFTLALLSPFFLIWDHPFLLSLIQWLTIACGAVIVLRTALRSGLGIDGGLGLALFFVGYPLTQSAALAEFHGVALYFFLVPWLYSALRQPDQKRVPPAAWIPLCLVLGTREDAFLVVLGMLSYFFFRRRSAATGLMAVFALLYGVFAVFLLFPWINGVSLFEFRSGWFAGAGDSGGAGRLAAAAGRLKSVLWVLPPALPLLRRRGWVPLASFTAIPLLAALASASPHQYGLRLHYSAPVMVCLVLSLLEAAALKHEAAPETRRPAAWAVYLAVLTIAAHLCAGFVPGGARHERVYGCANPDGKRLLEAAGQIPEKGVLICREGLTPFCANRADLLVWEFFDPSKKDFDLIFMTVDELRGPRGAKIEELLREGVFGVLYRDDQAMILKRGYDTGRNHEIPGR